MGIWKLLTYLDIADPVQDITDSINNTGAGVWIAVIALLFAVVAVILIRIDKKRK